MSSDPGLFEALRRVSGTALSIFQSRLELATLEISIASQRILTMAMLGLLGVSMLMVGAVALSGCVVLLLWDRFGVMALAGMGLLYLLVGIVLILKLRHSVSTQPPLLEETNAELQRDAGLLRGPAVSGDS